MDDYLTVAEIAALLKLNQQTVRNWIDAGELPAIHIGRRVRVRREDFERMVAEGYTGARRGPSPAEVGSIWEGEIPAPVVPHES